MRVIAKPAYDNRNDNPYNWLLYSHVDRPGCRVDDYSAARLVEGRYDIWHLHWPESFLNSPNRLSVYRRFITQFLLLSLARIRGTRIVWTVHNLQAHERLYPRTERIFWRLFFRLLDGYICMSETGRSAALERFPRLKGIPGYLIPHGHYRGVYPDDVSPGEARDRLGIGASGTVVAFIGQIRPYKNVPPLVEAFRRLGMRDALLLVAGKPCSASLRDEIVRSARNDARVRLRLEHLPAEELQVYLKASDLVVLPYREILNSGSAILSLSFGRPVLVPRKGSLGELQQHVGDEWVRTYPGELDAGVLEEAIAWARGRNRQERPALERYDWDPIASRTIAAYRDVCGT